MAMTQNKLTPLLVVIAAVIVGYVLWVKVTSSSSPVASGSPMTAVPRPAGKSASSPKSHDALDASSLPATRSADADTPADTLATVAQTNKELRAVAQKVLDDNERLKRENAQLRSNTDAIADRVRDQVLAEIGNKAPAPAANPPGNLLENGVDAASRLINGVAGRPGAAGGVPPGLGFDGTAAAAAAASAAAASQAGLTKTIAPVGYRVKTGTDGSTLERHALAPQRTAIDVAALPAPAAGKADKASAQPYFTIPENATLARSTAMTMLVGRVPIDGRVQDPMQFKLVIGRENLAASGQYVPDDVSGVIVSGIAIGDMALSCTEGWVQSMTFVFDDGTIRTVSMRRNGASAALSGGGTGGASGTSLASTPKLGSLSDEFGNPCIPGQFVTNAPAYLADVIGAKSLSVAGAAIAAAQTTTTMGSSALGSSSSTTVTGDKGRYVLGQVANAGSDEVVRWLMQRLNNSFDAVVVRAGTRVVVHVDQPIEIDKEPDGRRLDHRRGGMAAAQQGGRYGLD